MTLDDMVRTIVRQELAAVSASPATTLAAAPKPRGRPPKVVEAPVAAPAPAPEAVDPFTAAPVAPVASLDDVRKALTALKDVTSQANALAVLKAAGDSDNLSGLAAEKYDAVVAAATAAAGSTAEFWGPLRRAAEEDPFETPAAVQAPAPSLEDVKNAVVAAQKRTSTDAVQKVVMAHGGTAPNSSGGSGPSLKALKVASYAAVIAAVAALPTTK